MTTEAEQSTDPLFYLADGQAVTGPYAIEQISAMAADRKISLSTMIAREGTDTWKLAAEYPTLRQLLNQPLPPSPGEAKAASALMKSTPSRTTQIQVIGFVLLIISIVLPAYQAPIVGGISTLHRGEGLLLAIVAAYGIFAALKNQERGVKVAAGISAAFAVISIVWFYGNIGYQINQLSADPYGGFAVGMLSTLSISWGWAVVLIGVLTVFFADKIAIATAK